MYNYCKRHGRRDRHSDSGDRDSDSGVGDSGTFPRPHCLHCLKGENMSSIYTGDLVEASRIIYTASDFTKANLNYIQEIGSSKSKKPHVSRRTGLQSILFFIVVSGKGILTYDGTEYILEKGNCAFIDCHKPYSHTSTDDLWNICWVHFYGPSLHNLYENYLDMNGQPVIRPLDFAPFMNVWEQLYQSASSSSTTRDIKINADLSTLWSMALSVHMHSSPDALEKSTVDPQSKFHMEAVREFLEKKYKEKLTLDQLSEEFYINKYYLTRIYKDKYGETINETLQRIRITHAKELLRFTDLSIEEIGLECGLGALNYFSRTFKY